MPGFVFNLQSVLDLRLQAEEQRRREMAEVLRLKLKLEEQLRGMQQSLNQSRHALTGGLVGRVDLAQVAQFTRYQAQVRLRAQGLVIKLAAVEQAIERSRAALVHASRDRRALELLRDRRREAWMREQERRAAAELDALALQRHLAARS